MEKQFLKPVENNSCFGWGWFKRQHLHEKSCDECLQSQSCMLKHKQPNWGAKLKNENDVLQSKPKLQQRDG